ncbi:SDR family NAD(P)-dependent oxidoreductase [Salipiger mangrovisoli]|uniref:SDR family oxidoreductase n=1 Tax=Salipiger mangrovisoli TaxID=2865933 RepID=A0ABR9XA94_9RHOB|nr:SDR family oxidoreductase [Salipiger mangrovisoli]MBE9640521.1 SDR family oxidoreductase [Salipiger mangrovisoli]
MTSTVLVSGASRGIGYETAKVLAHPDSHFDCIVMVARPSPAFDTAFHEVCAVAGNRSVIRIDADLADSTATDAVFDSLDEQGIRVTDVVNNAGFTKPASINEIALSDFEFTMRVNVFAPFRLVQEALKRGHPLKKVINIASTAGINGRAGWLTYSASKAAVINMSEVMREELSPYGVEVVCLSPGRCATDLRRVLAPDEDPKTIMQPQQVAEIIRVMTSPLGKLLNTNNLVVRT